MLPSANFHPTFPSVKYLHSQSIITLNWLTSTDPDLALPNPTTLLKLLSLYSLMATLLLSPMTRFQPYPKCPFTRILTLLTRECPPASSGMCFSSSPIKLLLSSILGLLP